MKWQHLLIALLLVSLNFGSKFQFLHSSSFNLDEAYSVYYSQQDLSELSQIFEKEANPPTHFLLLHGWIKWFGISEISVRSLSLLFSSLVVGLAFLLFRSKTTLVNALLLAVGIAFCEPLFFYGNEARVHAISGFAGVLSFFFLLRAIELATLKRLVIHSISLVLLMYLHYANFVLILVEIPIVCLIIFRKNTFKYSWVYLIGLLSIVPIMFWITSDKVSSTSSWIHSPSPDELWPMWIQFSNGANWFGFTLIVALAASFILVKKWINKLVMLLPILYIAAAFFVSMYVPFFIERYIFVGALLILFCIGYAISKLEMKNLQLLSSASFVLLLILTFNIKTSTGEDWKGAVNYVKTYYPEAHTLVAPVFMYRPFLYYADQDEFKLAGDAIKRSYNKQMYFIDNVGHELFNYIKPDTLIYISKKADDVENIFILKEHFKVIEDRWFIGLHLLVLEKKAFSSSGIDSQI